MTLTAFILILFSVTFHAAWNLMAKKSEISIAFYALLSLTTCTLTSNVLFWTPVHYSALPWNFWGCMMLAIASDCVYGYGLVHAYRTMDMSAAYPIMRSLPLLLTMPLSAALGYKSLPLHAVIGMIVAFYGCLLLPLKRLRDFKLSNYLTRDMLSIFITACGTTGYTVMDGQAQRIMRAVSAPDLPNTLTSVSYYAIRCVFLCSTLAMCCMVNPADRRKYLQLVRGLDWHPILAGLAAALAYTTVLTAMNFVTNITYVQMLRLLALPVGVFIGVFILGEKGARPKFVGVTLVLAGMLMAAV